MNNDWRPIPSFPSYEINFEGDVRSTRSKKLIKETKDYVRNFYYYRLSTPQGARTNRSYLRLLHEAFPELNDDWRAIPNFEEYQVSRMGQVRHTKFLRPLVPNKNGKFRLSKKRIKRTWSFDALGKTPEELDKFFSITEEV